MLTVEERFEIARAHEAALHAARELERAKPTGRETRLDTALRCTIDAAEAHRVFYRALDQATLWQVSH